MYKVRDYEIKTSINEMTIAEFESISALLKNESLETIERYFEVLEFLGVPEAILDELTDEELFNAIKSFNTQAASKELKPSFELGGYTYRAYEDGTEFSLKARDLSYIEKAAKTQTAWLSYIMAIIFKREDLGKSEHYADAHIKFKAKIFGELNAGEYYPYMLAVTERINQQITNYVKTTGADNGVPAE